LCKLHIKGFPYTMLMFDKWIKALLFKVYTVISIFRLEIV